MRQFFDWQSIEGYRHIKVFLLFAMIVASFLLFKKMPHDPDETYRSRTHHSNIAPL